MSRSSSATQERVGRSPDLAPAHVELMLLLLSEGVVQLISDSGRINVPILCGKRKKEEVACTLIYSKRWDNNHLLSDCYVRPDTRPILDDLNLDRSREDTWCCSHFKDEDRTPPEYTYSQYEALT